MNATKHTTRKVIANDERGVWEVYEDSAWLAEFESESEANLHATAPELLEALTTLTDYMLESHQSELDDMHSGDVDHKGEAPEDCSYCRAIQTARVAIAKAEGS